MGSSRFPGKSFYHIQGRPSLSYLVDGLLHFFSKDTLCVLTSTNSENNVLRKFCEENQIQCYSGSEENVASRFYDFLEKENCDYFVRINGDSPLFCADELYKFLKNNNLVKDFYSTILHKTYPKGVNFEIIKTKCFLNFYPFFVKSEHFEHVTNFFYENLNLISHENICNSTNENKDFNFCFDTIEDLKFLEKIFGMMDKPHFEYSLEEKCKLAFSLFYN
jgi:spore coat polysaccharide biosynthesis protein SpsF